MPQPDEPLTLERIISTAEEVVRRFGPNKATLIDVARVLGVSHAAVYRYVANKAELRDLVVERWIEATMLPLRVIVAARDPATQRLRQFFDMLIASKRRRAKEDRELFAAYRALVLDAKSVVEAHVNDLIDLTAQIVEAGVSEGAFATQNCRASARAILYATLRFHHPMHAEEWDDPAIDETFDDVWQLLMHGLRAHVNVSRPSNP